MRTGLKNVEEFGSVLSVDIHCGCPSSLNHAVTLPTLLISPISGFFFFPKNSHFSSLVRACVCTGIMSDSLRLSSTNLHKTVCVTA